MCFELIHFPFEYVYRSNILLKFSISSSICPKLLHTFSLNSQLSEICWLYFYYLLYFVVFNNVVSSSSMPIYYFIVCQLWYRKNYRDNVKLVMFLEMVYVYSRQEISKKSIFSSPKLVTLSKALLSFSALWISFLTHNSLLT